MSIPGGMAGAAHAAQQQNQQQQPTQQQVQAMQQQFFQEAAKRGLTPQQFAEQLKKQQQQQQQQHGHHHHDSDADDDDDDEDSMPQPHMHSHGHQVPITPGPPSPEALAVAKFLRSQDLKSRTCIFEEKRRELFKVKRAIRAIQSPAYEKAQKKAKSNLPEVTDRESAETAFKLLPMSMLALRVSKIDGDEDNPPHGHPGHRHGAPAKGQKGVWTVKLEPHQDTQDPQHYMWFYEGSQWKQKLYALGGLVIVMAVVLFPLWPYTLRVGVWYLSMAALGLLGAFFGLAIVRLILFLITIAAVPPGIWLYPNLFEDVGFFDSFRPIWAWRETKESIAAKKAAEKEKKVRRRNKKLGIATGESANGSTKPNATTASNVTKDIPIASKTGATGSAANEGIAAGISAVTERRNMQARVEEDDD